MDAVANVLTSSNVVPLGVLAVVLILLVAALSKLGLFSFSRGGLRVGKNENEVRALLMRQVDFVTDFLHAKCQDLMTDMRKKGIELDYIHTSLVFEKMMDRVLQWLLINNIRNEKSYISVKTNEAKMTILAAVGEINYNLLLNDGFVKVMDFISQSYTEEIIAGLLAIKENEQHEKKERSE